ncbi:MAG TPA: alpha/beta hydrolase [Planctomycetaceae bacterium]|jgi:acetyl esterase/lipase|nr:alpha/beta hydrolase [Planctomycetaceae bacterium]
MKLLHRAICVAFAIGVAATLGWVGTVNGADDSAAGRSVVLLWPEGAPGALGTADKDKPTITVHLPASSIANGCAVVICPGGGYQHLAMSYEGHDVAEWFNTFGVAGIVLKYRLAPDYHHPSPLLDVQRAIRIVREKAGDWHIDPHRVGVMGFSAGGHLASTAATHFDAGKADASDPIDHQSCRPDFAILAYPVITMTEKFGHGGSKKNLLGAHPEKGLAESLSNETQVTAQTPPTFLFHTAEDSAVPVENSVEFFLSLRKAGVPAEMHVYEKGRHGLGLGTKDPKIAFALGTWPGRLHDWMQLRGLLALRP